MSSRRQNQMEIDEQGYGSGASEGAISPDTLLVQQDSHWIEHRRKLDHAMDNDAPLLELTIQSSATLIKGEKIQVNALGLVSHESQRAFPKAEAGDKGIQSYALGGQKDGQEQDLRDGAVFFGCKKSVKVNVTNMDAEQTTIVSITNE